MAIPDEIRSPAHRSGPLTARAAYEVAVSHAHHPASALRLTGISSESDIDPEGCSKEWWLEFLLPSGARLVIAVLPSRDWDVDGATMPLDVLRREHAAPAIARAGAAPHVLPVPFRDSPEAVRALQAQGVDFGAGPENMQLQSIVDAADGALWLVHYWDHAPFTTPFAAGSPAPDAAS